MYKLTHLLGEKEKGEGETKKRIVLGYARVSATKQKKELLRQQEQLRAFAYHQGWQLKKVFTDITSGMNEQRKGLHRLLNEVVIIHPFAILCTYEDRTARFETETTKRKSSTYWMSSCL